MKKYFLVISMSLCCFSFVCAEKPDEIYQRLTSKRFEKLEAFEAELEKYGLTELDAECLKGEEEACFVLEKLEKELTTFIQAAKEIERLQKEQETPLTFDDFPHFVDKYAPGFSNSYKEYSIKMYAKELLKAKEHEMNKLRKMECKTTADVEGMKQYLECGKKKMGKKYKRLQEKYPNDPIKVDDSEITQNRLGSPYYPRTSDRSWLSNLRFHKRSCTKYGYTRSCVELQKMRKK